MTMLIHHEIELSASPARVFAALTDGQMFSELTGAPAAFTAAEGTVFSCFGGVISGRHIELVPAVRVVQAWRVASWSPGHYSLARFELRASGSGTALSFFHDAFPDEQREHLDAGWHKNYWEPLKRLA